MSGHVQRQCPPPAAGLDDVLPWSQRELPADQVELGALRDLQRRVGRLEVGAGVNHALVEPEPVEVVAQVVVDMHVLPGGPGRSGPHASGVLGTDGRRGPGWWPRACRSGRRELRCHRPNTPHRTRGPVASAAGGAWGGPRRARCQWTAAARRPPTGRPKAETRSERRVDASRAGRGTTGRTGPATSRLASRQVSSRERSPRHRFSDKNFAPAFATTMPPVPVRETTRESGSMAMRHAERSAAWPGPRSCTR